MSLDDQVREYMCEWCKGTLDAQAGCGGPNWPGRDAGWLAYFAAERAERERLDGTCPVCQMGAALKAQGPAPVGIDHLASYVDDLRAQVAALAALAADAGPEVKP